MADVKEDGDEIRSDGWSNLLSGYGTRRDPIEHARPRTDASLPRSYLDDIYRADGIGRRIVDLPAEEMTRQWVKVEGANGEQRDADLAGIMARQAFNRALRWAGLYGGAVMLLRVSDGSPDYEMPLNEAALRSVDELIVYDRHQVQWTEQDIASDPGSRWFGRAEYMTIQPVSGTPFRAHRSRLLVFDGEDVPDMLRARNSGWGDSRLQPVYRALARYSEGMGGASSIVRDFILPVLSMKGLSDMIASGQEETVRKRLEILGVSRSMLNVLLIDSDDESYDKKASAVSGIDKLLNELKHNLSACTGIPQTLLFGRAPEGMNATGEGDQRNWYDQVASEQQDKLIPNLSELVRLLDMASGGIPGDREIVCNPLWQPDAQEQANTRKTAVEAATMALEWGLIDEETARGWVGE